MRKTFTMEEYRDTKILIAEPKKYNRTTIRILSTFISVLIGAVIAVFGVWGLYTVCVENIFFSVRIVELENLDCSVNSHRVDPEDNFLIGPEINDLATDKNRFLAKHGRSKRCEDISDDFRFDCYPEDDASVSKCEARGCCWAPPKTVSVRSPGSIGAPYCFYPTDYPSYYVVNTTKSERRITIFLARNSSSYYRNDIMLLRMDVTATENSVRTKIYDPVNHRYEVPYPLNLSDNQSSFARSNLGIEVKNIPFAFKIFRKDNDEILFDTTGRILIYTDQFIQISSFISNDSYIYGLGERRDRFLRSTDWQRYLFFAADQPPANKTNLYGSHPFMLQASNKRTSVGILLYNSNAMEMILQPAPAVTYRTIGGILDFVVFTGSTPADVIRHYVSAIGLPAMPPFWSLGFHLSRWGYKTVNQTRDVWQRTRNAGIPFDVQWNDIDYMDQRRDFTLDKVAFDKLPEFVNEIHRAGMRYVVIIDPAMDTPKDPDSYPPYADGLKRGIFINGSDGKPFIGKVWSPNGGAWPDFMNPAATDFWTDHISEFHEQIPVDGLWIDMNEPANFYDGSKAGCPVSRYENPPYVPHVLGGKLYSKTVCMTARQHAGIHYNVHSLYGYSETIATNKALRKIRPGKRPFIISRSTFPGQGHYGGHWTGDISSTWDDMRKTIPGILDFNLFGIPLVGADICGFRGNTTAKLCQRWMELGAFYPFSRNHNEIRWIDQDPVALGPDVIAASRNALLIRYMILPHIYTLFYRAHLYGDTVARPLFFEFGTEVETYSIDTQFLLGPAFMVLPVLEEDQTHVDVYLPRAKWYVLVNGTAEPIHSPGTNYKFPSPPELIVLAFRGGYIFPGKAPTFTTSEMRKLPFVLIVAMDENGNANGELFWDDGESLDSIETGNYNLIKFICHDNMVRSSVIKAGAVEELTPLGFVQVYGVKSRPTVVLVNKMSVRFDYDLNTTTLKVPLLSISLFTPFQIVWN